MTYLDLMRMNIETLKEALFTDMAQIICRDLELLPYDGETVLSDINFSLDAGAYLCIVGENGFGKSTLSADLSG